MAQTNVTKDENQETFTELFYPAEFVRGVDGELIFLSALNILISFYYCISGEHSDPTCRTQGNFTSYGVQTPVS